MKKTVLLLTAFALTLCVYAQPKSITEEAVPASVKTEFSKTHPSAFEVSWKKYDSQYIVAYSHATNKSYATYSDTGVLIESRDKITTFALPAPAYEYVKQNYAEVPKEYFKITDSVGLVTYAVKINGEEAIFDKKGTYLKTVAVVL